MGALECVGTDECEQVLTSIDGNELRTLADLALGVVREEDVKVSRVVRLRGIFDCARISNREDTSTRLWRSLPTPIVFF